MAASARRKAGLRGVCAFASRYFFRQRILPLLMRLPDRLRLSRFPRLPFFTSSSNRSLAGNGSAARADAAHLAVAFSLLAIHMVYYLGWSMDDPFITYR